MPLTIINRTKPFTIWFGDAGLTAKAPTPDAEQALIEKHTHEGKLNERAYTVEYVETSITDWNGVTDQEGQAVPFNAHQLWHLRFDDQDPAQVIARILLCLRGLDDPLASRSWASSTPSSGESNGRPGIPA